MEIKRKQYQLEQSIEKTLYILTRIDPEKEIEEMYKNKNLLSEYVDTYYRRYKPKNEK